MPWGVAMRYTKPFRTIEEQAGILAKRGMEADYDHLVQCLENVGYYRLSGFWHIFKQPAICEQRTRSTRAIRNMRASYARWHLGGSKMAIPGSTRSTRYTPQHCPV